jgi:hypothetical protein
MTAECAAMPFFCPKNRRNSAAGPPDPAKKGRAPEFCRFLGKALGGNWVND